MPVHSRLFRVFVSSTFADMREERRLLQSRVFPRLREHCESHGAQFQAIDLRWGVTEQSSLDQSTMDTCLGEIRRCQQLSPKPNFIALLGERYGWQPLPAHVEAQEFERVLCAADSELSPERARTLRVWYRRDDNAIPPEYLLQPRPGHLREYRDWEPVENMLRNSLRTAVTKAGLAAADAAKYFASATHQEILLGALGDQQGMDASEHVLALARTVRGMPKDADNSPYLENDPHARHQMAELKRALKERLGPNYLEYASHGKGSALVMDDPQGLADRVYEHLRGVIDAQLATLITPDEFELDRAVQAELQERLLKHFEGRQTALAAASEYLDAPQCLPFVFVGPSGSGKSSVMAKSIADAHARKGLRVYRFLGTTAHTSDHERLLRSLCQEIARGYGTTPEELFTKGLSGPARELRLQMLQSDSGLAELFLAALGLATAQQPLTVFLDSLDQLSKVESPATLDWLPSKLPPHAALVVSCLCGFESRLVQMRRHDLAPMPIEEAGTILDTWLAAPDCHRALTRDQRDKVLNGFATTKLPIYLRLAFETARTWHSYDRIEPLPPTIEGILDGFFAELEHRHTPITVAKAVGGLLSGRHSGLQEGELLDFLAHDEEHWQAFLARTHPDHVDEVQASRALPVVVWARLFLDIEPFLSERNVHGVSLLTFFHRQFIEHARRRYCQRSSSSFHPTLARYFAGLPMYLDGDSQDRPNVRRCTERVWQAIVAGLWDDVTAALCSLEHVQCQVSAGLANELLDDYGDALARLPSAQTEAKVRAEQAEILRTYAADLLHYAESWTRFRNERGSRPDLAPPAMSSVKLLQPSQAMAGEVSFEEESLAGVRAFATFVRREMHHLVAGRGERLGAINLAYNSARSGPVAEAAERILKDRPHHRTVSILRHERDEYEPCPGRIMTMSWHRTRADDIALSADGRVLVTSGDDPSTGYREYGLGIWDAASGRRTRTIKMPAMVNSVSVAPDGQRAVTGSGDGSTRTGPHLVQVWDLHDGQCMKTLAGHTASVESVACTPDLARAVSGGSEDFAVRVWDLASGKCTHVFNRHDSRLGHVAIAPDGLTAMTVSEDHRTILWDLEGGHALADWKSGGEYGCDRVFHGPAGWRKIALKGRVLLLWNERGELLREFPIPPTSLRSPLAVTPDGRMCLFPGSTNEKGTCLFAMDLLTGQIPKEFSCRQLSCLAVSPDGRRAYSGERLDTATIGVWDLERGAEKTGKRVERTTIYYVRVDVRSDGKTALAAHPPYSSAALLDTRTMSALSTISPGRRIDACRFLPDERFAVFALDGLKLALWDLVENVEVQSVMGASMSFTYQVKASADGSRILSGSDLGAPMLWDLCRPESTQALGTGRGAIHGLDLSPDGRLAIAGGMNTAGFYDLSTGTCLRAFGGQGWMTDLMFLPSGRLVVTAHNSASGPPLQLWDVCDGHVLGLLDRGPSRTPGERHVESMVCSLDGERVASATRDGRLTISDVATLGLLKSLQRNALFYGRLARGGGHRLMTFCDPETDGYDVPGFTRNPAIVTAARLWDVRGRTWSDTITVKCTHCGARPPVLGKTLDTISSLGRAAGLSPNDVPCLKLPAQAWDEPQLLAECPNCRKELRFNPFVVDRRTNRA